MPKNPVERLPDGEFSGCGKEIVSFSCASGQKLGLLRKQLPPGPLPWAEGDSGRTLGLVGGVVDKKTSRILP
jgi:hypothetical protein